MTYYFYKGEVGACSRNYELMVNEVNKDNTIIKLLIESGLFACGYDDYALQGELMGPGIQTNHES